MFHYFPHHYSPVFWQLFFKLTNLTRDVCGRVFQIVNKKNCKLEQADAPTGIISHKKYALNHF